MTTDKIKQLRHNILLQAINDRSLDDDEKAARCAIANNDGAALEKIYKQAKPDPATVYLHLCHVLALDAGQALPPIVTLGDFKLALDKIEGGGTLLHVAAEFDALEVIGALLALGCDPLAKNTVGATASDIARQKNHPQALEMIQKSIDEQSRARTGQSLKNIEALDRLLPQRKPRRP